MLRITTSEDHGRVLVRAEGWLAGDERHELERVCAALTGPVEIDLSEVIGADGAGVRLLRDLQARGVALSGVRPYLELLIRDASSGTR